MNVVMQILGSLLIFNKTKVPIVLVTNSFTTNVVSNLKNNNGCNFDLIWYFYVNVFDFNICGFFKCKHDILTMIKFIMPIRSAIIVEIVSKSLKCNIGLGVFLGTFIISS